MVTTPLVDSSGLAADYSAWNDITPHASTNIPGGPCRAIYVGVAGDVTMVDKHDNVILFKALPVGIHRLRAKRVNAVGTAATNLVALF